MSLVVPEVGEILMLQYIVNMIGQDGNAAPSGGQRLLRLFGNNVTPADATVIGDLTEMSGNGYAAITLLGASWTTTVAAGVTTAVYSEQTFTFSTNVTIYGYYVTTIEGTPRLLWLQRFSNAPLALPDGGGTVGVSPRLNNGSCS